MWSNIWKWLVTFLNLSWHPLHKATKKKIPPSKIQKMDQVHLPNLQICHKIASGRPLGHVSLAVIFICSKAVGIEALPLFHTEANSNPVLWKFAIKDVCICVMYESNASHSVGSKILICLKSIKQAKSIFISQFHQHFLQILHLQVHSTLGYSRSKSFSTQAR